MTETKKLHKELVSLIVTRGLSFDKKHGKWVFLRVYSNDPNSFLELDTWNRAITLKSGSGEYNYWRGFEGETVQYFGSIFGRYESSVDRAGYIKMLGFFDREQGTTQ